MPEFIYADDVRPGDLIMWAGRVVEVLDTTPDQRGKGRYLRCDIGNEDDVHRLHWHDNEVVALHHRAFAASSTTEGTQP